MTTPRTPDIWLLGATGRTGRAVAARLRALGTDPVVVGRNEARLREVGDRTLVVRDVAEIVREVRGRRPAVVVNTLGDFAGSGLDLARACLPGGHYVDLANDMTALPRVIALDREARAGGSVFVTGAGFGVLGTQSLVARLAARRADAAATAEVDGVPSVANEPGRLGEALAVSIVDGLAAGSLVYRAGRPVPARAAVRTVPLPGAEPVRAATVASGDLYAAWAASGAAEVSAASAMAPTAAPVRALMPLLARLARRPAVHRFLVRRLAGITVKASGMPRPHTWSHARLTWDDGHVEEGWLRTGDAMAFTAGAVAETAVRLRDGRAAPGAHTPAAAFGPELAEAAGGEFVEG